MSLAIEMDMAAGLRPLELFGHRQTRPKETKSRDPGCHGVAELCGPGREENPQEVACAREALGRREAGQSEQGQHSKPSEATSTTRRA